MRRIPQLDGGYDQDDDYADEEEEGSDYSSADRTESEDDEEEVNAGSGRRNSQRLQQHIEKSAQDEKGTNTDQTKRKKNKPHKIKAKTKTSSNSQQAFDTSQRLEAMAEEEKPKRKRGRPPKDNKDNNLVPSPIQRGRGRPPTVKKVGTEEAGPQNIIKSQITHQNQLLPPPAPYHHNHRYYDSNSSMPVATCLKCRKHFENGDALKNHAFWCDNSTRMTRSKRTGSTSSSSSPSVKRVAKQNKEPKSDKNEPDTDKPTVEVVTKHRGRPFKANLDNVVPQSGLLYEQLPELSNKPIIHTNSVDNEAKVSKVATGRDLNRRSNSPLDLTTTATTIADDDDGPVVCPKCHARYRKLVSLQNHMPTCVGSESSEEEEEEQRSDDDIRNAAIEFENNSAEIATFEETGQTEASVEKLSHPRGLQPLPPAPLTLDGRENRPSPQINYDHQSPCQNTNTFQIQQTGQPNESTLVLPPLPQQTVPLQSQTYPSPNLPQYDIIQEYQSVPQQQMQQQQDSSPQIQQHEMTTILQDTVTGQLYSVSIPIPFRQTHQPATFAFPQYQLQGQQVNIHQSQGGHRPAPRPSPAAEVTTNVSQNEQQLIHHKSRNIDPMVQLPPPPLPVVPSTSGPSPHYRLQLQNLTQQLNSFQFKATLQQQLQPQPPAMSPPLPNHHILHTSIPPHMSQSQGMDCHNPQNKGHRSHSSTFVGTPTFLQRPFSQQNDNDFIPHQEIPAQFQQPQLFQSCPSSPSSSSMACLSSGVPHPHLAQQPPQLSLNQQLQLAQQSAFHQTQLQQFYHNQFLQLQKQFINVKSIGPSSPNVLLHSQQQPLQLSYQQSRQEQPSLPTNYSNQLEKNGSILSASPSVASELQHPSFSTISPTIPTRQTSQFPENQGKIAQPQLLNASQGQVHHQQTAESHHQQQQLQQNAMLESFQRQIQLPTMGQCIGPQVHDLSASPYPNPASQVTTTSFQLQQFPSGGIVLQQLPPHHGVEKYRKVFPPSQPRPIEPKPAPQAVEAAKTNSQGKLGSVKSQLASMILGKNQKKLLHKNQSDVHPSCFMDQHLQQIPPNLRKNPILTAVVRPMENPLQKLSHQISQIESTFNSLSGGIVNQHRDGASTSTPQSVDTLPGVLDANNTQHAAIPTTPMANNTPPRTVLGIQKEDAEGTLEAAVRLHDSWADRPGAIHRPRQKKKADTAAALAALHSSQANCATSPPKPIQLTLKRNERGGSYSVKYISETSKSEAKSKFKSLKISARIASGELEGTMTNVVVEPKIHIIPIPDPDGDEVDSNLTIPEDGSSSVIPSIPVDFAAHGGTPKLAYRAVVLYEVSQGNTVIFRSSDVRAIWCQIFETAQGTRLKRNLPPLSYPATTVSLVHMFNMLGLTHRAVQFLLNHLPQPDEETPFKELPLRKEIECDHASGLEEVNESGCARTGGYTGRKPFDMFGWLASKHRKPLEKMPSMGEEIWKPICIPLVQRYRNLKERTENTLVVMWSIIHGRGLYTRRDIDRGDIVIEYAGEVIRSPVCDQREKFYETKGIGCYMFRIDDEHIIDATMKGNAARFINHSCEPNCESKQFRMSGAERIVILALRKIFSGEELTYDYKFEKEENKIPCACASRKCRKYLN